MSLVRIQIPSPNHSGPRPSSRLLVVHTSEGATTFRNLGNFLANPSSQVSYQVGFDNTTATQIGEYVAWNLTPWSAMAANSWGQHGCCCTPSGASSGWSRAVWLGQDNMLRACAAWLSEEAARGVPLVKIGANEITAGRSGICGHGDCSAAGAGGSHTDPGPNFPWDVVIGYAIGAPGPAPEPDLEEKMYVVFQYNNGLFLSDGVQFRWIPDIAQVKYIVEHYGKRTLETHPDIPDTPLQFGAPANADTAAKAKVPFP